MLQNDSFCFSAARRWQADHVSIFYVPAAIHAWNCWAAAPPKNKKN
jgi:hypothetical protein